MTNADSALGGMRNDHSSTVKKPGFSNKSANSKSGHIRRLSTGPGGGPPPAKVISKVSGYINIMPFMNVILHKLLFQYFCFQKPKPGVLKEVTLAEAGKYGTLNEYAFFDKVWFNRITVL